MLGIATREELTVSKGRSLGRAENHFPIEFNEEYWLTFQKNLYQLHRPLMIVSVASYCVALSASLRDKVSPDTGAAL